MPLNRLDSALRRNTDASHTLFPKNFQNRKGIKNKTLIKINPKGYNMKKTIELVLEKLSENSTWRGLILLGTALGVKVNPELQESIIVAGLGLVGLINVIRKG
jgi:hypothetical protein